MLLYFLEIESDTMLNQVPVVNDFLNVFQHNVLGLPPVWDI